ncbi:MAG: PilX N-terminal domain-containing pilus assembly protein [Methylococcaceae bacterium]
MNHPQHSFRHQGAVLPVSLIILLVMTLVGVTSMQTTSLEEKMAGNSKDSNLAFQAAEAALRSGEMNIEAVGNEGDFDGTLGLFGELDTEPDYLQHTTWADDTFSAESGTQIPTNMFQVKPRYYVKYIIDSQINNNANINIGGYGENIAAGGKVIVFKVVGRGTGKTASSQVVLQSFYGKRF